MNTQISIFSEIVRQYQKLKFRRAKIKGEYNIPQEGRNTNKGKNNKQAKEEGEVVIEAEAFFDITHISNDKNSSMDL